MELNALNFVANIVALGSSFLCGIFVPLWLMGDFVKNIAQFLPAYWYTVNNNMISGFTGEAIKIDTYWKNMGIQGLFVLAILAIFFVCSTKRKSN